MSARVGNTSRALSAWQVVIPGVHGRREDGLQPDATGQVAGEQGAGAPDVLLLERRGEVDDALHVHEVHRHLVPGLLGAPADEDLAGAVHEDVLDRRVRPEAGEGRERVLEQGKRLVRMAGHGEASVRRSR
jgi:hypothetical protein